MADYYCTDCEQTIPEPGADGRCSCGSGRVVTAAQAPARGLMSKPEIKAYIRGVTAMLLDGK